MARNVCKQLLSFFSDSWSISQLQIVDKIQPVLGSVGAIQVCIDLWVQFHLKNALHPCEFVFCICGAHSCIGCFNPSYPD